MEFIVGGVAGVVGVVAPAHWVHAVEARVDA